MSHDIEASYAALELVNHLLASPADCFGAPPATGALSGYAAREGRHEWPHADGVIELSVTSGGKPKDYSIALEFKRPNEGLHGVLTAIGQSHAYLRKGYAGAVMVIPSAYPGFSDTGTYVKDVLDLTSQSPSIGVITYSRPDMSKVSPFANKLTLHRPFKIDLTAPIATPRAPSKTETQWAHVREGSSDPDAFFKYLQAVKLLGGGMEAFTPKIPKSLAKAIQRVRPQSDPERYLSNCPYDSLADKAWRHFWFKYVLHDAALPGWQHNSSNQFSVNENASKVLRSDGKGMKLFFVGRTDSIKNKSVDSLNAGSITEDDATDNLVENYFKRAHSYREDIDSGCAHLGFVDSEGRLTDIGFKFVDACERFGNPNEGLPRAIFLNALLSEGALGAFLHYIYRLSEQRFSHDPMAFATITKKPKQKVTFDQKNYLKWLEDEMRNSLHVIRKVSLRGGTERKPFQAELAVLRSLGIVSNEFRMGVGLVVNWPEFQESLSFSQSSYSYN
jgi:hypothetical protein